MNDPIRISGLAGFRIIWLGQIISALAQQMFGQQVWVEDRSNLGFPFEQGLGCFMLGEGAHKIVFHPGGNHPGASCLLCLLPETGQGAAIMTNGLRGLGLSMATLPAIAQEYNWRWMSEI